MGKLVHSYRISTYTKIMLSHCQLIADLITKHSLAVKDQVQVVADEVQPAGYINLLSDEQLNDVLSGPYQDFFRIIFTAYGMTARIRRAHVVLNDDALKQSTDGDEAELEKLAKISVVEVVKLEKKLDELVTNLDQALCNMIASETQKLTEMMQATGLKFTENDFIEFRGEYPPSELEDRLVDLLTDVPKLKPDKLDFSNYFYLKLYIAVYSSLGVEHKENDFKSIQPILKQFMPTLEEFRVKTEQWHNDMQAQVDDLMSPIAFARNKDIN